VKERYVLVLDTQLTYLVFTELQSLTSLHYRRKKVHPALAKIAGPQASTSTKRNMGLSIALIFISALLSFSSALPLEPTAEKRSCGFLEPNTLISLYQNDPNTSYPNTIYTNEEITLYQDVSEPGGKSFTFTPCPSFSTLQVELLHSRSKYKTLTDLEQKSTGIVGDKINALIAFPGTAVGSYGCTLHVTFPDPYTFPTFTGSPSEQRIDVYTVPTPLPSAPTWANIIHNDFIFGTFTAQAGLSVVINSESCPTAGGGLAFMFSYASEVTQPESIGWTNYVNELNGELIGVWLSYDC
jgi:hypothetical protein